MQKKEKTKMLQARVPIELISKIESYGFKKQTAVQMSLAMFLGQLDKHYPKSLMKKSKSK